MEDIILGRHTKVIQSTQKSVVGVVPFVDYDKDRVLLIFAPNNQTGYYVCFSQVQGAAVGFYVPTGGMPVILDIKVVGDMVRQAWSIDADSPNQVITYYQGHLHKE